MLSFMRFAAFTILVLLIAITGDKAAAQGTEPAFSYVVSPDDVPINTATTITYTIDNSASGAVSGLGFTHSLPTTPGALTVSGASANHTCPAGTLVANDGAGSITLSGASLDRGATCTITVPVSANAPGSYTLGSVVLASSAGNATAVGDTLDVTATAALGVIKTLSRSIIDTGEVTRVGYTFTNNGAVGITTLSFDEILPATITIATSPNLASSCEGPTGETVDVPAGGSNASFDYFGFGFGGFEVLAVGESCSIAFDVAATVGGEYAVASGPITFSTGGPTQQAGVAVQNLTVNAVDATEPQISKAFSPSQTGPSEIVDLTFTLQNSSRTGDMTSLSFTDDLDAMLSGAVAVGLPATDVCGTGSTISGISLISMSGGTLASGASCEFTVQVQLPAAAPAGSVTNVTSAVTGSFDGGPITGTDTATASLTVQAAQPLAVTAAFTPSPAAPGTTPTIVYTIANPNAGAATDVNLTENFAAFLPESTNFTGTGDAGCTGGTITTNFGTGADRYTLSGLTVAGNATCVFTVNIPVADGTASGTYPRTTNGITATINGGSVLSASTSGNIVIEGGADVSLAKVFNDTLDGANDGAVVNGNQVEMVLTVSNSIESSSPATAIAFTDDLDAFSTGTTGTVTGNTCNGTASMSAGNSLLSVSGVSLAPDAECAVTLTLTIATTTNSDATNSITDGTFSAGGVAGSIGTASATLRLGTFLPVTLNHVFAPATVVAGETTQATYTIDNPNPTDDATSLVFTHDLNTVINGMTITGVPTTTCGGTAIAGGPSFLIFSSGTASAGSNCEVVVDLIVPAGAASNSYSGQTSNLSYSIGGNSVTGNPSNAILTVENEPLLFSKQFIDGPVVPGGTIELEYTLENPLGVSVSALAFDDDFDAVLSGTLVASSVTNTCGGSFATGGGALSYSGGSLAANASCTVRIGVSVDAAAAEGLYTSTSSTVSGMAGGSPVESNTATDTLGVSALADTEFSLVFGSGGQVDVGGTITGQYTLRNAGTGALNDMRFSHELSSVVSGLVASNLPLGNVCGTGSSLSGTSSLVFDGGNLLAGESCQFSVTFSVPANDNTGTFALPTSAVTSNGIEVTAAISPSLTINPVADIAVTMTDGATTSVAGQTTTYTSVFSNSGPSTDPAVGANIDASATAGCSITAVAAGGATGASNSGPGVTALNQTLAMPVGSSVTYTSVCDIAADAAGNLVVSSTGTPSVTDPQNGNNSATDTNIITQTADLGVTLADDVDPVLAGGTVVFTANVTNAGPSDAANAVVTFTLPSGLTLVSTSGCAADPSGAPSCSLGTIAASGNDSFTVTAAAGAEAGSQSTTASVASGATDSVAGNNAATETTEITGVADIAVTMTDNATSANAGETTTFITVVSNDGPSTDPAAAVQLDYAGTAGCAVTAAAAGGATGAADTGPSSISVNQTLAMPSGSSVTYTATCDIAADASGFLNGSATATSSVTDPVAGNNTATDTDTEITASHDLSITKSDGVTSVVAGMELIYSIEVGNAGPSDAAGATVTDSFPSELSCSYVARQEGGATGATASGSGDITDTIGVPVGGTVIYRATCLVDPNATGTLSNTATIAGTGSDPDASNNSATDANTAITPLTFDFTKAFAPSAVDIGQTSVLTLTIDNSTNKLAAGNIAFTDPLPAGMALDATPNASTTCSGGTLTATGGDTTISLSGASVAANSTCTVTATVLATASGSLSNTTSLLTSDFPDTGPAVANLAVNPAGAPLFTKDFAVSSVPQGEETTLTLVVDNSANSVPAANMAFTDTFPAGLIVAAAPATSNTCGGTVNAAANGTSVALAGGSVAALSSCEISVAVRATGSGDLVNTSGDLTSGLPTATGPSATLRSVPSVMTFSQAFAPDTILQGQSSTVTFTIDNAANAIEATNMAFSNALAGGLVVADAPSANNTCGGTFTAAAGATTISLAGGAVVANGSCAISVDVTAPDAGTVANTTSVLTSSLVDVAAAAATLEVTEAEGITFVQVFTPSTIDQGATSVLSFSLNNRNFVAGETLAFTNSLPDGVTVADAPAVSNTCGGTFAPTAGDSSLTFEDGVLAAQSTCEITVAVRAVTAGDAVNTSSTLTSNTLATSPASSATLSVTASTAPGFESAFAPATIAQGEVSTLSFNIDNAANLVAITDVAFANSLPTGLTVAALPNVTNSCGGTVDAAAGASAFNLTGATLAEGASCSISVDVQSSTAGTVTNTSGTLTSSVATAPAASATLTVTAATAPTLAQSFQPAQIAQGGQTNLILTIDNTGNAIAASDLGLAAQITGGVFTDGSLGGASNTCGGTLSAPTGGANLTLTGGSVPAGGTCTISVPVTSVTVGTVSVSGALSSSLGGQPLTVTVPLTVIPAPDGQVTFVQQTDDDGVFNFTSSEGALNFSIATIGGSGSSGAISVQAGTYTVTQQRPDGFGNTSLSCSDANSTTDARSGTVTLRLEQFENVTCTYSAVNSAQESVDTINAFLQRRNNLILSNGPNRARRLARLSQGIGTSQRLAFQHGDIKSFAPVDFNLMSLGSGSYSISTSLRQVERAKLMFQLAHDGIDNNTETLKNRRFDVWFEAHYSKFNASAGSGGHFGIAYLGADYLVSKDVLAGFMLQYDTLRDENATDATSVDGRGWMVGPYVTARLAPNLIFDGRLGWGKSTNDIILATSTGQFDTERFLIDLNLSGNFDWNNWVVSPNFGLSYIEDSQDPYVNSLAVLVPGQKVSLGQIKFGPTFSTSFVTATQTVVQPTFTVNGIYNFANTSGASITNNTADETDGFRGRIEASVKLTNKYGSQFNFGANYDGIGKSDFESWGVSFGVSVPLE